MSFNKRILSAGAADFVASENFNVVTYTGNGGTQAITGVGFKPDWIWCKCRSTSNDHNVTDSNRGVSTGLNPNTYAVEGDQSPLGVTVFGDDGFTVVDNSGGGASVNGNNITYVAWCWKSNGGTTSSNSDGNITSTVQVNSDAGFSIITYTGTGGSGKTIGHGLGVEPSMYITKRLNHADAWRVTAKVIEGYELDLADNYAKFQDGAYPDYATSSVIKLGTGSAVNTSGGTYVTYCFANIDGFSKVGSYTGNGSANGPIVETGFEPAFIMVKRYNTVSNWVIYDNKRNTTNPRFSYLMANTTTAETGTAGDSAPQLDFLSNGFQPSGTEGYVNANGDSYLYMAFAADPDEEAPTLASSFNIETYTGNGGTQSITGLGFSPNLTWIKDRSATYGHRLIDSVSGPNNYIESSSTASQQGAGGNGLSTFDTDGFTLGSGNAHNRSGDSFISWNWKADDNEPTIFPPNQTVADIKSTNLTLNLNLAAGSYSGTGTDLIDLSAAGEDFSRSSAGNVKEGFGGYYIDLEGNDQYWTSDSSVATTTGNNITIEFWIRDEGNSASYAIIIDANHSTAVSGSSGNGWVIQQRAGNQGSFYFYYYNGSGGESNSDGELFTLTNDEWTHIAIVKSGTSIQVYKNGVAGNSWTAGSATIANPNQKIRLGQWLNSDERNFWGSLAQVRLYSDALSSSEVTANYDATKNLFQLIESIVSANANAGFSIVKWTGTGSAGKVPHGLSSTPDFVVVKRLDGTTNWQVWYTGAGTSPGSGINRLYLNTNDGNDSSTTNVFYPDATKINLNSGDHFFNTSGGNYIAYCFHSVSGYSKFGTYTGNGTASGPVVTTGFQPDFLMVKRTDSTSDWGIIDSARGSHIFPTLFANKSDAELTSGDNRTWIEFISTGFQPKNGDSPFNANSGTYIYMAFKIN